MPTIRLPNGLNQFYRSQGEGERVLLLIHGNWGSSRWWERVMGCLPPGVRAVAPDLRGCGDTERPDGPWSMADLAADLHQLTEALGIAKYTVVGHSLGGSVALQLAVDQPQAVEGLVMVNGAPADGLGLTPAQIAQVAMLIENPAVAQMALAAMMPTAPKDAFYQQLLDEAVAKSAGAAIRHTEALEGMRLASAAAHLALPTLIIYGAMDPLVTREMATVTAGQIPGATLEVWEGLGHSAPVEAPERFAQRMVEFLGLSDQVR